jgi:Xaa-Pro aminopeptidase
MSATPFHMTAPPEVFQQRRAKLGARLTRPMVVFAGHAPARNYAANAHEFRPGSTYTYFGGPPLEHAAWLIEPKCDGDAGCRLLRPMPDPDDAIWVGESPADEDIAAAAGLRKTGLAKPEELAALLAARSAAAIVPPFPDTIAQATKLKLDAPTDDELRLIVNMRLCKDEHELDAMRRAAAIGMDAQRAAWMAVQAGVGESDVAAAFMAVLIANGARPPYTPIVTIRGEILHATSYANTLHDGDMLLIDASAEEPGGYVNDITRTLPVSGEWSPVQRHLYDTVLRANAECVQACVPGRRWRDVHFLAARIIAEGLVEAELLSGDPDMLVERNAHALFYPHGLGHLIGLDVHDMRDFGDVCGYPPGRTRPTEFGAKYLRFDRDLAPGMTVTVEPGIYIVPNIWQREDLVGPVRELVNRPAVDALLRDRFGGIRIEHTLAVRATGEPEVFTAELPVDADEVASAVAKTG